MIASGTNRIVTYKHDVQVALVALFLSLTYVKSTTLYSIKYFLLIQPNYNTQTLVNRISSNLTIEWNRMNRMPSIPPKRMPRMESNNRITIE